MPQRAQPEASIKCFKYNTLVGRRSYQCHYTYYYPKYIQPKGLLNSIRHRDDDEAECSRDI